MEPSTNDNAKKRTELRANPDNTGSALVPTWINLGVGMAEATVSNTFGLLQDARSESRELVTLGIDSAENMLKSVFRIVRKFNQRVDELSTEAIGRSEDAILSGIRAFRTTTTDVTALAGRTTTTLIGVNNKAA